MNQKQIWLQYSLLCSLLLTSKVAHAQITPDNTLGAESSSLTPNVQIKGAAADSISGGAQRGSNLFHSFSQFNVGNGQRVYFVNPSGIQNILTRVTGKEASNILGTLGVNGSANLFLLNPNGILFGPNARLDVGGSFVGTTASAFRFGEQGEFSATNPEAPALLTVKPSALFFNQLNPGAIANKGLLTAGTEKSLVLAGGDISFDRGLMAVRGGQIELVAIAGTGTVELNPDNSLSIPTDIPRADVSLFGAQLYLVAGNGGSIAINARNLDISGDSYIASGIGTGEPRNSQTGDITLNATGTIQIREGSRIRNNVFENHSGNSSDIRITAGSLFLNDNARLSVNVNGQGNAGSVIINARDQVVLDNGATIFGNVGDTGKGDGGNIRISTGSLSMTNDAGISAQIYGQGNAGDIVIDARDRVSLGNGVRIISAIQDDRIGTGGNIRINTPTLSLTDRASVTTATFGQGDAKDILIDARDLVSLDNGAVISSFASEGNGGNIRISTESLSVISNGQLNTSTFGQGNAGNIIIDARDRVTFDGGTRGRASAISQVGADATGQGGNITINSESLLVDNGARIGAVTSGQGNAGNIIINARDQVALNNSAAIFNNVQSGSGKGEDIRVTTGTLKATNLAILQTATFGQGNAGNVIINARDRVEFAGGIKDGPLIGGAVSLVEPGAVGNGGNVEIETGSLSVIDRTRVSASTRGRGNAGNVIINARDNVWFDNSGALSTVNEGATGNGGNIQLTTGSLTLTNGAQFDSSTFSQGNSGNIIVNARDTVSLDGYMLDSTIPEGTRSSTIFTEVYKDAQGKGGDIYINTGSLVLTNSGQLDAKTRGRGDAGNIYINARDRIVLDGAKPDENPVTRVINSVQQEGTGKGGNIEITTGSISVTNGAQLFASTLGRGDAGNIIINARDSVSFDGTTRSGRFPSAALSSVNLRGVGKGGDIRITAGSLSVTNGAELSATTSGEGKAGNLILNARDRITIDDGIISSAVGLSGQGDGGSIFMTTGSLNLNNKSVISVGSSGSGEGGDIQIQANTLRLRNQSQISAETATTNGGSISLNTSTLLLRQGSFISTTAGTAQAGGNGGNITVNANAIVAIPKENSDITANAFSGRGGNITINTNALFGIVPASFPTLQSDITASSQLGVQGQIDITQPDVQPGQGLIELPSSVVDATNQIAQICPRSPNAKPLGEFIITGRGSLSPNPLEPLAGTPNLSQLATLDSQGSANVPQTSPEIVVTPTPPAIVEAQGWVKDSEGNITLVAFAPQATPNARPTTGVCPVSK